MIAPLDWGLGHVTRCVPVVQHILSLGHSVVFAGNNSQQNYIRSIYPTIEYADLVGYNTQYSKSKIWLVPKIVTQIPRLKKCIKREHLWLQSFVKTHHIDAVISDNRYGLYHSNIPCIFVTHQLQIRSGYSAFLDKLLLKIHYRFIEKFTGCWVVDIAEDNGLSGSLGHPEILPKIKTEYIGLLSQCAVIKKEATPTIEYDALILLSGAEPQRSILADALWNKSIKSDKHIVFVAGSDTATVPENIPPHILYRQRLSSDDLVLAIQSAGMVICRSGYSSLMDLIALDKKAILIPTPGQTEQEYLASKMNKEKIFMAAPRSKFDIQTLLINASVFPFSANKFKDSFVRFKPILDEWLNEIKKTKTV
ncbi:MAG: glycosyltransferase [Phycisphaerales bacterium]|nr:glycosyltransferase [Phycisphaerales bacterium]